MGRLGVAACVLLAFAIPGDGAPAGKAGSPLAVRIVPSSYNEAMGRSLGRHFYVVATNLSRRPIKLWRDWCSWGYFNLSFQATDRDGRRYIAKKRLRGWDKNYPDAMIVPPGDHMVFEVTIDETLWQDAPWPVAGPLFEPKIVRMKAVYEVQVDGQAREHGVWTGRITSPEETCALYR